MVTYEEILKIIENHTYQMPSGAYICWNIERLAEAIAKKVNENRESKGN